MMDGLTPKEIILWIKNTFTKKTLTISELKNIHMDLVNQNDGIIDPTFFYELSKCHSFAAFLFWQWNVQIQLRKNVKSFFHKNIQTPIYENSQFIMSPLFPVLMEKEEYIFLRNGESIAVEKSALKHILKPLAFRELIWYECDILKLPPQEVLQLYTHSGFVAHLQNGLIERAAILAGIKMKAFQLAFDYASKRMQGGRIIKEWSLIQSSLCELQMTVSRDNILVKNLTLENSFPTLTIIQDADQFVSACMQIFGGAGYTADFEVERLYRESLFLKNWPTSFRPLLISCYPTIEFTL